MINTAMRTYRYYTYGLENEYGQQNTFSKPAGFIKMAIYLTAQNTQSNPLYESATFVGLTFADIDETFVIEYGKDKLKVLYVNPLGRYKQVYLTRV